MTDVLDELDEQLARGLGAEFLRAVPKAWDGISRRLRAAEAENIQLRKTIKALNIVGSGTVAGLMDAADERDVLVVRQAQLNEALDIAVTTLIQVGWEGSSVNYPARQALNKIRDLGFGNVEQRCRVELELAKYD